MNKPSGVGFYVYCCSFLVKLLSIKSKILYYAFTYESFLC